MHEKIWEIFAILIKTYQNDSSFTCVDGIEVAHQLKHDKLQYDLCSNLVLGRGTTIVKRE
jgi:hypothetical protein